MAFKDLFSYLTIDKSFVFTGKRADFIDSLHFVKGVYIKIQSNRNIKIFADNSWGTLIIQGGFVAVDGIHVIAETTDLGDGRLKINFTTRIRPEHYFTTVAFIIFLIAFSFSKEPGWAILYIPGLWVVSLSWFHFLFRLQEKSIINILVDRLRLSKWRE